jgi:hypothetical protein
MTDYHYSGPLPFNRQYRIQQNFFVSADVGPDMTIVLDFDLSLGLGGRTSGGTDFNGNATGPTDQSIFVGVYNASAAVSNNGNRFIGRMFIARMIRSLLLRNRRFPTFRSPAGRSCR